MHLAGNGLASSRLRRDRFHPIGTVTLDTRRPRRAVHGAKPSALSRSPGLAPHR